jgi:catalase
VVQVALKTIQEIQNVHREEPIEMVGQDPDFSQRDLFEAIERGEFPKWRVCVQIMNDDQASAFPYNPFDLTKVWPQGQFPLHEVGVMTLNRNPENYLAEVEQAAFAPANIVPGIGYAPDKMLHARILSYPDAHRHRMGVNYDLLPVNKPKCSVDTYHRDGHIRFDDNGGREPNYEPNSFDGPVENPDFRDFSWGLEDSIVDRYDSRRGNDDYAQAGDLFRLLAPDAQRRLIHNIVMSMKGISEEIQTQQIKHFLKADVRYGRGVMEGLCYDRQTLAEVAEPEGVLK